MVGTEVRMRHWEPKTGISSNDPMWASTASSQTGLQPLRTHGVRLMWRPRNEKLSKKASNVKKTDDSGLVFSIVVSEIIFR